MCANATGLGLAALSAVTFGTAGSWAASLMTAGWTPGAAVTARISIAAILLTVPALFQLRGRWALMRRSLPAVFGYGLIAIAGAQLCYFNAVDHLSVGVALLLEYSGVVLVVLWQWLRHGQRPTRLTTVGALLAIFGLMLVLDITGNQHVDLVGVLWGLGAATGLATYFVISSHAQDPLPPIAMSWAGMAIAAVTLGLAGITGLLEMHASTADANFHGHHTSWLVPLAGMSIIAGVVAYAAGIGAARRLGARLASFVGLAEVLSAVLFAWLLLGQRPGLEQGLGGLVVLAGIALVQAGERAPAPSAEPGEPAVAATAAAAA